MANWITAQEVVTNTSINANVDKDNYNHLIKDAQITIFEPALGSTLYRKIDTDFNADTLAGDYLELFTDYIKPALCHSVYASYLRDANVMAYNGGIFTKVPEGHEPAKIEDIKFAAKGAQSRADVYLERMLRYLCDKNIDEYDQAQDNNYDLDPRKVQTTPGWHFGNQEIISDDRYPSGGSTSGNFIELE